MAKHEARDEENSIWLRNSGCSSHMIGQKNMYKELDETHKHFVKLGTIRSLRLKAKAQLLLRPYKEKVKLLHNVQFVPNLAHNLLSVGQLLNSRYTVMFDDDVYSILDKKTRTHMVFIHKTKNNMFPLEISDFENFSLTVKSYKITTFWHQRYGTS